MQYTGKVSMKTEEEILGESHEGILFTLFCPRKITTKSLCESYEQEFEQTPVRGVSIGTFKATLEVFDYSVEGWTVCLVSKCGSVVEQCVVTDQGAVMGFYITEELVKI